MKIVARITDCGDAALGGGDVHSTSVIIDVPNPPQLIMDFLKDKAKEREIESYYSYQQLSFSVLDERADTQEESDGS
jgi:hypothetical protein